MTRPYLVPWSAILLLTLRTPLTYAQTADEGLLDRATLRLDAGAHSAALTSVAATRDGRVIATGSEDRTVRLWDGPTGALLRTLRPPSAAEGSEGKILAVAFSPDGRLLAAGGVTRFFDDREQRSSSVYLFDTSSGAMVRRLPGSLGGSGADQIGRIVFSPDATRLVATRGRDHTVGIYDTRSGAALDQRIDRDGQYVDADFDAAGRLILCQLGGRLRLYDPALQLIAETQIKDRRLAQARFSPDGKRLAVLGTDGRVELLGARDLRPQRPLPVAATALAEVTGLVFSPDGMSVSVTGLLTSEARPVVRHIPLTNKSPPRDEDSPSGVLRALAALPGGELAFAARDGSWGVVAPGRSVRKYGGLWTLDASPEALLVDQHGEQVELRLGAPPRSRLRFRVPTLELQLAPGPDAALHPPRTEVPSPHRLTGWRHQRSVVLDGRALFTSGDDPAALAIAPDQRGFVLGTDRQLLGFVFATPAPGACPYTPSPESQLKAPCFARQLASPAVAVNYSGDGRFVVVLHEDGTVRWYDSSDGRERLALWVRPEDSRWVLFRPDGRYAAAAGSAELVGWQVNRPTEQAADFFPLSRLRASREHPDEVAATLAPLAVPGTPIAPSPARMLRAQLPPVATLLEPVDGSAIAAAQVTLKVSVRSPTGQPVTAVHARIDGRPAAEMRGILTLGSEAATAPPSDGTQVFSLTVNLPPRDCVVSVTADSAAGPSAPAVVRLRWRGPSSPTTPTAPAPVLYVLAIGVGDYQRPELQLRYPAKDARDLAALLSGQRGPGRLYERVEQRVLTDRQATKAAVLEALDWLQHRTSPTDTTVLFLAGHGLREPTTQEYYFLPADAEPNQILKSMLPASTLQQILGSLPGRVLLLLDTCHAGGVLPGRRLRGLPAHQSAVDELASAEGGVVVMAAATGAQASAEDVAWQNGAFTKALLEGLTGRADLLHTGRVTVNMIDLYVSERVRELTAGSQTPATAKPSTIADFPLVTIPARAP